jgi:3-oxoacyl-[acyl-carrier protein] reductase
MTVNGTSLDGSVALVTGASRGIGAAVARALGTAGAAVAVNYRDGDGAARAVADDLAGAGHRALAVQADVRDPAAMAGAVAAVTQALGRIDILVCNATGAPGGPPAPLAELDPEAVIQRTAAQLAALLIPCRAVIPGMREQGSGHVIFISSTWSQRPSPGFAPVAIAKAAADAAVRSLAVELGNTGIRVNAVAPGFVNTELSRRLPEDARAAILARTPLRRPAEPHDVAGAVLALAVPASRHVTGTYLPVDGGGALA